MIVTLVMASVLVIAPAAAQQPPRQLPAPAEPGLPQPVQPPPRPTEPPQIIIPSPEGVIPPGADQIRFVLRDILVEGATVYSSQELREVYAHLIGTEITLPRLFEIAERIQEKYRADGYLLTRVIVPQQTVTDGVFRLQVIEGFISQVRIEGEVGPVKQRIRRYLNKITTVRPIREQDLERYLFLVNDIPGVHASGVLRRGAEEVGASELVVKVERDPFAGYVLANNRGSKFTGPKRAAISLRENAATAFGERVEVFLLGTEEGEQQFGRLTYEQLLGSEGLKLGLWTAYGTSDPGFTLAPLDVETDSLSAGASLTYPLIRSRKKSLFMSAGFEATHQQVDVFGERFTEDDLRVVFIDALYEFSDPLGGQSTIGLGLRQGLSVLGASDEGDVEELSRPEGVPDFTALNFRASRHQSFDDRFGLYVAAIGQLAFNTLLSDEEFRVGGEIFGRGYDPSELAGDHGLGLTVEPRYTDSWRLGPLQVAYQAYAFYDLGVVWNRDRGVEDRDSLASAGLGVRNRLLDYFSVDLELAWPLTRTPATQDDKDVRFFLQLSAHF